MTPHARVAVLAGALLAGPAWGCSLEGDDVTLQRVAVGYAYPDALHVVSAVSSARLHGKIDRWRPIDAAWAEARMRNERLVEIKQMKGQSETHPLLSPNDEFANYEIMSVLLGLPQDSGRINKLVGSYARQALKDGLAMQDARGYNYDVVWSGKRKPDRWTGRIAPIQNTVDIDKATYTNTEGAVELKTVWTDPEFDPSLHAFYYARVLEIATPRWTTIQARQLGIAPPDVVPATVQERAWTSPIWYTPYKLGDTYYAARGNEFGYANYEILPKPPLFLNPLGKGESEGTGATSSPTPPQK